jgi:hypothetical protein
MAVRQLGLFVEATVDLFTKIEAGASTQLVECVASMKAHTAPKLISRGPSWFARVCAAILNLNCGHAWKLWGYEVLRQSFG